MGELKSVVTRLARFGACIVMIGGGAALGDVCCRLSTSITNEGAVDPPQPCTIGIIRVCMQGNVEDEECGSYPFGTREQVCVEYVVSNADNVHWRLCVNGPPSGGGPWRMIHSAGGYCCYILETYWNGGSSTQYGTIEDCRGIPCAWPDPPPDNCPPEVEFPAED